MKILFFLLALLVVAGCDEPPIPTDQLPYYSVSGNLIDGNGPIENIIVSIDHQEIWTDTTSATGNFSFININDGNHILYIEKKSKYENSYCLNYPISVTSKLVFDNLKIPSHLVLHDPYDVTQSSMSFIWNRTDAEDFIEYRLYRDYRPEVYFDEAELRYRAQSIEDTSFVDSELAGYKKYYYRLFLVTENGITASKVTNDETLGGNLFPDGGFENVGCFLENWSIVRGDSLIIEYDTFNKVEGNFSLHCINTNRENIRLELNKTVTLAPDILYELSCWIKISGMANNPSFYFRLGYVYGSDIYIVDRTALTEPIKIDWTYVTTRFVVPDERKFAPYIVTGFENFWIDDLKLVRVY